MKYRKKPVVVEARQITIENAKELAAWCGGRCEYWMINPPKFGCIHINTLEGEMYAKPCDWIIKGIAGEFYPCKPDIFEKTYEIVEENNA